MREIKFRAWDKVNGNMVLVRSISFEKGLVSRIDYQEDISSLYTNDMNKMILMQYTGLKDKNGTEIYEGDIVGEEGVYKFLDREGWEPSTGNWKVIGEKTKNFTGEKDEKYIAGYELYLVEWRNESCGFEPFSDSKENCQHCGGGLRTGDLEVIGNIYENPELLTN
jgi:uncharacterized phage protein (TIGR01671 family)